MEDSSLMTKLLNKELRKVEVSQLTRLSNIIDTSNDYKKLIEELEKPQGPQFRGPRPLRLSPEAINLIKHQVNCEKSPTLALLNCWSITGRRRPTIGNLLHYLRVCRLVRAEEYVREAMLGLNLSDSVRNAVAPPPPSPPSQIPPRPLRNQSFVDGFDIGDTYYFEDTKKVTEGLQPLECPRFSFQSIYESTNGFCHKPYDRKINSGSKVGEGRFSSVFRAKAKQVGQDEARIVAAKLLKSECNITYLVNEIDLTLKIEHENILEILGVSLGSNETQTNDKLPHYICLVYEYVENGSLLDCLSSGLKVIVTENVIASAATGENKFITWQQRFSIAQKIARGISYLHTYPKGPIIHRDIKSANIFINSNCEPKIGDFTLIRQLVSTNTQFSQNIIGTSVYMPPEAFRGDISIKFDTFSFGIVLMELLTGLRPFQEDSSEDLFTYITGRLSDIDDEHEEMLLSSKETEPITLTELRDSFLREILDKRAGHEWTAANSKAFNYAKSLFEISLRATETRKKDRPELTSLLPQLESLVA